jgi:DNA adenine methylase
MNLLPPIGYFGSKIRVAPRIVDLLPAHRGYVEPFAGALSVLLAKQPTSLEVVNDIDQHLVTFWRVLRDRPTELVRVCALTPHSRAELAASWPIPEDLEDELERARRVWVLLTQGRGRQLRSSGWRNRQLAGDSMPENLRMYVERLGPAADRLAHVTLECLPALEVIDRYGRDPDTLLYVDPPYLYGVRAKTGMYAHEMGTAAEHRELADALAACRSSVAISGYPHPLYDELYAGWDRTEIAAGTGQCASKGYQARTEVLWCNRPLRQDIPLWEVTA